MTAALLIVGALIIGALLTTGLELIRRGHAETGRHRARCAELEQAIRTRAAARPPVGCLHPWPRLEAPAARPGRLPGYAAPIPGPGRFLTPDVLNVGPSRSATSPVDLEADVQRMCTDAELYVAGLIAATRHAERGHPW